MTDMTPSKALEPGHVQLSAQMQASVQDTPVRKSIAAGADARDEFMQDGGDPVEEETVRDFVDAGLAWLLFRPGVSTEFMARIGVWDGLLEGLEFGLRYDTKMLKGDAKVQLFESDDERWAVAADFGFAHHLSVVNDATKYLTLTDFSRNDLDFQLSGGVQLGDVFRGWVGPRVIASRVSAEPVLPGYVRDKIPPELEKYDPNQFFDDAWLMYYGVTAGMMVGYKYVFLALELSTFRVAFRPEVFGEERNFDGTVFAPAAGLVVTW